jgi:hypothetical protein
MIALTRGSDIPHTEAVLTGEAAAIHLASVRSIEHIARQIAWMGNRGASRNKDRDWAGVAEWDPRPSVA